MSRYGEYLGFISRASSQLVQLSMLALSAMYLDPVEFGVYSLASAFTILVQMISFCGLPDYMVREEKSENLDSSIFWVSVFVAVILSSIVFIFSYSFYSIFGTGDVQKILGLLLLGQPLAAASSWYSAILMREGRTASLFKSVIIQNAISICVGVFLVALLQSIYALVVYRLISAIVTLSIFVLVVRRGPSWLLDFKVAKSALKFSSALYGSKGVAFLYGYGAEILIGAYLNVSDAGLYRFASRFSVLGADIIFQTFRVFAITRFARAFRERLEVNYIFLDYICAVTFFLSVFMGGLIVWVGPAIEIILPDDWILALPVLYVLCMVKLASVVDVLAEPFLALAGNGKMLFVYRLTGLSALLLIIGISAQYGLVVVAFSQLAVVFMTNILAVYLLSSRYGFNYGEIVRSQMLGYFPLLVFITLFYFFNIHFEEVVFSNYEFVAFTLVVVVVSGGVLYFGYRCGLVKRYLFNNE